MQAQKSARPWFLYIIETKHDQLYTGVTLDWQRRFEEHNTGSVKCAKALRGKGPLTLRFCAKLNCQKSAMQAEIWMKKQVRIKKLQIINGKTALPYTHTVVCLTNFGLTQKYS